MHACGAGCAGVVSEVGADWGGLGAGEEDGAMEEEEGKEGLGGHGVLLLRIMSVKIEY
jgi:hypothetical protein